MLHNNLSTDNLLKSPIENQDVDYQWSIQGTVSGNVSNMHDKKNKTTCTAGSHYNLSKWGKCDLGFG